MRSASCRLPGHPDVACDLVAETVVDEYLRRDSESRVRLSVSGGRGALFVSGDVKSSADFDVSAVVLRALGSIGVMSDIEPFISLEPVAPEQSALFHHGSGLPTLVYGYATAESEDFLPTPVSVARRIARRLEDLRTQDETWFWLGADAEIWAYAEASALTRVSLLVEQGTRTLIDTRRSLNQVVNAIAPGVTVEVNLLGSNDVRGLSNVMGASGREQLIYGENLPGVGGCIGVDPRDPRKAGAWLARAAARTLVVRGAKAVMVQMMFDPGEKIPRRIRARDELGKDRSAECVLGDYSIDRVMSEWWQPGLGIEAARWGFAGATGLPWEK